MQQLMMVQEFKMPKKEPETKLMVRLQESETLELKKSTSELKEAIISIAAILNKHQKGELYFGIRNDGEVIGQQVTENTIRGISQVISEHIEPKIFPQINNLLIEGKSCAKVEFDGIEKPYFAYGRAYIRVGDEDKQLSAKELENIFVRKNKDKLRWDNQICEKARLDDISSTKLKIFLKIAGLKYDTLENSLEKLKLMHDQQILNTAVILFGKNPQEFMANAKLRCAVFAGTKTSSIIDMNEFEGDLFYLIEEAQKYVLKNIHTGMRVEGLRRIDIPEIDKEALREAVINAFCHRDYLEPDSVNIAIFTDRVEIRNPGSLYGGLTLTKILKENVSKRRNELIAELFHRVHFIEKWGRGIELILSKEPKTIFKEVADIFYTIFERKKEGLSESKIGGGQISGQISGQIISKMQKEILGLLKANPKISRAELTAKLNINPSAIQKHINTLKAKSLIKRIGAAKGGYWEVIDK